ncbi:MAG: RpiB/LacA/LacB family sugar-phosphate isomerase [Acidobacteria bacterium]|nr:RpiB/LacA/LacB family sugar-phosphate isomerase [Acidobacteriota bacterium]
MRIAVGGDERNATTDFVLGELRRRGHEIVRALGPAGGGAEQWADVGHGVAEAVASGEADQGVVFCWTGTGVSIAANKVRGARAALCTDAEQARGARRWNDANVLALSLRLTTEALAREILEAWLAATDIDPAEAGNIEKVKRADGAL